MYTVQYVHTVEAQLNIFFSIYVFYCGASETLNRCIVSGETHQFVRPKMRQYF
jgi:hypothetical protein